MTMRLMFDAVDWTKIPKGAPLVAGYVDGPLSQWPPEAWSAFPGSVLVRIAVFPTTNDGHVLDVESGDAAPDQVPAWLTMRRAAGVDPTVYTSATGIEAVRAACVAAGVAEPHYWLARPTNDPAIPDDAIAVQLQWDTEFDVSVVRELWPGVDAPGAVTAQDLAYGAARYLYPAMAPQDNNGERYTVTARAEGPDRVYILRIGPTPS